MKIQVLAGLGVFGAIAWTLPENGNLQESAALSAGPQLCERQELQKLVAWPGSVGDAFGQSVAINDGWALAGALTNDGGHRSGSVFVFRRIDNGTPTEPGDDLWTQHVKLTASDAAAFRFFSSSVSISGNYLVVGAKDDIGLPGSAYVFRRDENDTPNDSSDDLWVEQQKLGASDANNGNQFGGSVLISGDRLVVGAYQANGAPSFPGAAYVFRRDDNGTSSDPSDDFWIEEAKLTASDAASQDEFGFFVAINGDRVIVGARMNDDAGSASGAAYVFRRQDGGTPSDPSDDSWIEEDKLTASDAAADDWFGQSVAILGDRAIVGAWRNDDAVPSLPSCQSGSAYVFRRQDNGTPSDPGDDFWVEEDKLTAVDASCSDAFGFSLSLGNDVAVIGRPVPTASRCLNAGQRIFFDGTTPALHPIRPTTFGHSRPSWGASDANNNDYFAGGARGGTVYLSGDLVLIGAHQNQAPVISGAAYVFSADAVCGDSCCTGTETSCTCAQDCSSLCGDGCCNGSENFCACPQDCSPQAACCDQAAGTCQDTLQGDCVPPSVFSPCAPCAQLAPECGTGACCPPEGGCMDEVAPQNCVGLSEFTLGTLCAKLDLPCPLPGCGPCRVHADVAGFGEVGGSDCFVDVDDVIAALDEFAYPDLHLVSDLVPCDGSCPVFDLDDVLSVYSAFVGVSDCPDPCPHGACCFADGNCQDFYTYNAMSETNCYLAGGTYCGNYTLCDQVTCQGNVCMPSAIATPTAEGVDEQAARGTPSVTIDCQPLEGSTVRGGQLVTVECLITTLTTQQFQGSQLDLACALPGGSSGSINVIAITANPDYDADPGPSSGGIPFLYGLSGLDLANAADCTALSTIGLAFFPTTLGSGATRYLVTIQYDVGDCANGAFDIVLENFSDPPGECNQTKLRDGNRGLIPFNFTPVTLTASPRPYGDVVRNGLIDIDDILCVLNAFVNFGACPAADIAPCGGNGLIDVDDIYAVLQAFMGFAICPNPCE